MVGRAGRRRRLGAAARWWVPLLLVLVFARAAPAELREIDVVGVAAVAEGTPDPAARDAALAAGIGDAVTRVVVDELASSLGEEEARQVAARLFGSDPLEYTSRYSVLEDRGVRAPLLLGQPAASAEYVLVMRALVDVDRVWERLRRAGLLMAPPSLPPGALRLTVVRLPSYAAYEQLRILLVEELGAISALPMAFRHQEAVLVVETRDSPGELARALARRASPGLVVRPLGTDAEGLTVELLAVPAAAATRD